MSVHVEMPARAPASDAAGQALDVKQDGPNRGWGNAAVVLLVTAQVAWLAGLVYSVYWASRTLDGLF